MALLAGVTVVPVATSAPVTLGGPDRMTLPPRKVPWQVAFLWTVLGIGMLLLAYMAYRLSRELTGQPPNP
jgi:hypothetical protein